MANNPVAIPNVVQPVNLVTDGWQYTFFNGSNLSPAQIITTAPAAHPTYAAATLALTRFSPGSGVAGAANTDAGLFVKALKTGPLSDTTAIGEIDGIYIYTQQHGVGDTGGVNVDCSIVGSAGGGAVAVEGVAARLDTSGNKTLQAHFINAYIEAGNTSATCMDGEAWLGDSNGLRLGNYNIYGGTPPTMLTAIQVRSNRNDAATVYRLTGPSDTKPGASYYGSPAENMGIWYDPASHVLRFLSTNGAAGVASLDQTGKLTVLDVIASSYLKVTPTTVAGLPAAVTAGAGAIAYVSDASASTFYSIVSGGGAIGIQVFSDGTNWRIG